MIGIEGTKGYSAIAQLYLRATQQIPFERLHHDFLPFLPTTPGLVIDLGAGVGRDAYVLSLEGHQIIAVEPLNIFRAIGKQHYPSKAIQWMDDALPHLKQLDIYNNKVDFMLSSGVWHHLNKLEQILAIQRVAELLKPEGVFAVSLRNGPAGVGSHVFPTHLPSLLSTAQKASLTPLLVLENQASLMTGKKQVTWSRLVLKKDAH